MNLGQRVFLARPVQEELVGAVGVGTLAVSGATPLMAFVERIDKALYPNFNSCVAEMRLATE